MHYAGWMERLVIGKESTASEEVILTNLFMAPRLFLTLLGVCLCPGKKFGTVFRNIRSIEWSKDPCDDWHLDSGDERILDDEFIQYPRCLQIYMLRELGTAGSIDDLRITMEEDVDLKRTQIQRFATSVSNLTSFHFMGTIRQLLQCTQELPMGLKRLHLGTWEYLTEEQYIEILRVLIPLLGGGPDNTRPKIDVHIENMVVGREDRTRLSDIEEGTYELAAHIFHGVEGAKIRSLILEPKIRMQFPKGFLGIISSSAKNLERLSMGIVTARWMEPITEITFDEVVSFVGAEQHMEELLIPWIANLEEEGNIEIMFEEEGNLVTAEEGGNRTGGAWTSSIDVEGVNKSLKILGFPCFDLTEDGSMLKAIRQKFPSLQEVHVTSPYAFSWDEENNWVIGIEIREKWTYYRNRSFNGISHED